MGLNDAQKAAISHFLGPMLVLAGPGSGKTTVITERAEKLVRHFHVPPEAILVVTFTREAAGQMEERFNKLTNDEIYGITFGTFHSVFYRILRDTYRDSRIDVISENDQKNLMKELINEEGIETQDINELAGSVINEISLVKNERTGLSSYHSKAVSNKEFADIYTKYHKRLHEAGLVDFDDMQLVTCNIFETKPQVLEKWRNKFRFILIDEFQDINKIQYDIIDMLARPLNNIFAVGDDDQSIYRFRGAKPEIMFMFEKEHSECRRILLNTNYRSGNRIVEASLNVIGNNKNRYNKELAADRISSAPVLALKFKDVVQQYRYIIKNLQTAHEKKEPYGKTAILFRTDIGISSLVYRLNEYNIPYIINGSVQDLFEHWAVQDICAYLKLAEAERADTDDFLRIMNRPKRYLSRNGISAASVTGDVRLIDGTVSGSYVDFARLKNYYSMNNRAYVNDRIDELIFQIGIIKKLSPEAAVKFIRNAAGYDDYLLGYAREHSIANEELFGVMEEFMSYVKEAGSIKELFENIKGCRELFEKKSKEKNKAADGVRLLTFHGAKGLEFNRVVIINAVEGIVPHEKAELPEDIEEERRTFYVAMTRAKKQLIIAIPEMVFDRPKRTSRFVKETGLPVHEVSVV